MGLLVKVNLTFLKEFTRFEDFAVDSYYDSISMIEPNSELIIDYELVRNNIQINEETTYLQIAKSMGIIKSNAYGHDLEKTAQALDESYRWIWCG